MKKLFCLTVFSAAIQYYPQSYQTKLIDDPIGTINCESLVTVPDFKKIESNSSLHLHIKSGSFLINVSAIIDKASASKIMISLYAKESLDNEIMVIASKDSQRIHYTVEGDGSGSYSGNLSTNDNYIINAEFKIIATGHSQYMVVLPLNLHLPRDGNNNLVRCFIDGTAFVQNVKKKKNKNRNKKNI